MVREEMLLGPMTALADLVRRREVSPVEVVAATLERIDALDPRLNAYIAVFRDEALRQARAAEDEVRRGQYRGPLHGMPISLKDLYDVGGTPTTAASPIWREATAAEDATVVRRLRAAGAIIVGKVNLHECAYGATGSSSAFGATRNPWDVARVPGGSSSGSAAAVAAGLCAATLGSDTGGSVRVPAAFCGIVGIKPTYGRVSRHGVFPLAWSLDHVGPLARTVEDAAIVLEAIAGRDPHDPTTSRRPVPSYRAALTGDVREVRVGVVRQWMETSMEPEVRAAVSSAIEHLDGLGARIVDLDVPAVRLGPPASNAIMAVEAYGVHRRWLRERPRDYSPDVRHRLLAGALLPSHAYLLGQRARSMLVRTFGRLYEQVDVLALATTPRVAPTFDEVRYDPVDPPAAYRGGIVPFTRTFNVVGLPAISVPCGVGAGGMPVGLQIVGRPFDEETVLRVAHAYEQSTPWWKRRPSIDG